MREPAASITSGTVDSTSAWSCFRFILVNAPGVLRALRMAISSELVVVGMVEVVEFFENYLVDLILEAKAGIIEFLAILGRNQLFDQTR